MIISSVCPGWKNLIRPHVLRPLFENYIPVNHQNLSINLQQTHRSTDLLLIDSTRIFVNEIEEDEEGSTVRIWESSP